MQIRLGQLDTNKWRATSIPNVGELRTAGLGIGVDKQRLVTDTDGQDGEIDGQVAFPGATFCIRDGDDPSHMLICLNIET